MVHKNFTKEIPMDDHTHDIARAPLPTKRTLHARKNVGYQLLRFALFNARMIKMVASKDD